MGFVKDRGVEFTLEEKPFYFAGINNYYLTYKSRFMVDAALDSAQALGLPVIRTWGFLDDLRRACIFTVGILYPQRPHLTMVRLD